MHFALPPRKTSFPPPYARVSAKNASEHRRRQTQYLAYLVLGILTIYLLFSAFGPSTTPGQHGPIDKESSVVIVTVLDEARMSNEYISMIKTNRDDYAKRHGYKTFYTDTSTYTHLTQPSPSSWALIPALRHALTKNHDVDYVWSLSPHAVITNPSLSLYDHIFANLTNLMLKDVPVVPPDSVIHTFSHLKPSQIYLILSQDMENLAHTSFILRNTATLPVASDRPRDYWAYYFLDAWFDPLYRAYAFQKAENHALEHIVQWHPTLLAKLAIIDQRMINSYNYKSPEKSTPAFDSMWQPGDLVVNLKGCESRDRSCEAEMEHYFEEWKREVSRIDGTQQDSKTD